MKNVFFISEFVNANSNSTGYYWSRIIRHFADDCGEHVIVAAVDIEDSDKSSSDYIKILAPTVNKHKITSRILYQFILIIKLSILILAKVRRGDVVFSGTNPALLLAVFPFLKFIKRFEYILLVHDIYPEAMVVAGVVKPHGLLYKLLAELFRHCYRSADKIIAIGSDMKDLIANRKKVSKKKIFLVQNWAAEDGLTPMTKKESAVFQEMRFKDTDFVLSFFGNIGRLQGIENLLEAAKLVKIPEIKFLFIGSGYHESAIKNATQSSDHSNVFYYGKLPQNLKNNGLSACDVAIISLEKGMYGLGVPSKAYFSMLADRPILAVMDKDSEISLMVDRHNIGWSCEAGNPEKLAALIEEIYMTRCAWVESMSPREILFKFYSENIALNKIYCYYKTGKKMEAEN